MRRRWHNTQWYAMARSGLGWTTPNSSLAMIRRARSGAASSPDWSHRSITRNDQSLLSSWAHAMVEQAWARHGPRVVIQMPPAIAVANTVLIAIATFRRPALLARLLDSLEDQAGEHGAAVLVVDNDPVRSAHNVCAERSHFVRYVVEETPGIAAARNRALTHRRAYDFVCFVDDDETVEPGWLAQLLGCAATQGADIVSGPVIPNYLPGTPRWVIDGEYFTQLRFRTGEVIPLPATNNTLVRVAAIDRLAEPAFDDAFSTTGGSDVEFFWRMLRTGCTSMWCAEAVVTETVHANRTSLRWILRRGVRNGNVLGRLRLREASRVGVVAGGVARVAFGLGKIMHRCLLSGRPGAPEVGTLLRGIGMVYGALGMLVEEYTR